MKKMIRLFVILVGANFLFGQKVEIQTLLKDNISIRALQIYDGKVWYAGTHSKFGFVSIKDSADKKQIKLSAKNLQFRTLAQNDTDFYTINIDIPAYVFRIDKKNLKAQMIYEDEFESAFYDAFIFDDHNRGLAISDPTPTGFLNALIFKKTQKHPTKVILKDDQPFYFEKEAHFAASNSNIAMRGNTVWIASGGTHARIFRFSWNNPKKLSEFKTPFIQGTSSQGIYSIDFFNEKFGVAVGGDYTQQAENSNNIATTNDGGETWQIQASEKNGGYKTCVKFRPKSNGKDLIAVGDQQIEFSEDYGKTWKIISDEKGLYVCEWIDENTLVFAGKNRIIKMNLKL